MIKATPLYEAGRAIGESNGSPPNNKTSEGRVGFFVLRFSLLKNLFLESRLRYHRGYDSLLRGFPFRPSLYTG
jgi:hypothetical protein